MAVVAAASDHFPEPSDLIDARPEGRSGGPWPGGPKAGADTEHRHVHRRVRLGA
jgi:hypothetical protein